MRQIVSAAVSVAAMFVATEASAIIVSGCVAGGTLYASPGNTAGTDLAPSLQCVDFSGNASTPEDDTPTRIAAADPFGITDWTLADRSDDGQGDGKIDLTIGFTNGDLGTWSVDGWKGYGKVFLTLRAANSFAAFLIDPATKSGSWTTTRAFPVPDNDLKRISVYYSPASLAPIPLPAAGWMLLGGIGAIGMAARRRKPA